MLKCPRCGVDRFPEELATRGYCRSCLRRYQLPILRRSGGGHWWNRGRSVVVTTTPVARRRQELLRKNVAAMAQVHLAAQRQQGSSS